MTSQSMDGKVWIEEEFLLTFSFVRKSHFVFISFFFSLFLSSPFLSNKLQATTITITQEQQPSIDCLRFFLPILFPTLLRPTLLRREDELYNAIEFKL